jgi:hypothetical protein
MSAKQIGGQIGAALLGICAFIAGMPNSLESQIPQLFPENVRGYLTVAFAIAAYAAHSYGAQNRPPSPPVATAPK